MVAFAQKIYEELQSKLKDLDAAKNMKVFLPDRRFEYIQTSVDLLKEKLKSHIFQSEEEEITYFKYSFPRILSLQIYHIEKLCLKTIDLVNTAAYKMDCIEKTCRKMEDFFKEHMEFAQYYTSGNTNFDQFYFLRKSPFNRANTDLMTAVIDPSACTIYSVRAATIMAYSMLNEDIRNMYIGSKQEKGEGSYTGSKLIWTDSVVGCIELIYALCQKGSFNHGKVSVRNACRYFEHVFDVKLGNETSQFQEILSRKSGYTIFIDSLKSKLNSRIDSIEENARR